MFGRFECLNLRSFGLVMLFFKWKVNHFTYISIPRVEVKRLHCKRRILQAGFLFVFEGRYFTISSIWSDILDMLSR